MRFYKICLLKRRFNTWKGLGVRTVRSRVKTFFFLFSNRTRSRRADETFSTTLGRSVCFEHYISVTTGEEIAWCLTVLFSLIYYPNVRLGLHLQRKQDVFWIHIYVYKLKNKIFNVNYCSVEITHYRGEEGNLNSPTVPFVENDLFYFFLWTDGTVTNVR